jgi:hypothetical protein
MFVLSLRVLGRWERNVGTESLGANEGETIGLIALSHKNKRGVVRTRAWESVKRVVDASGRDQRSESK